MSALGPVMAMLAMATASSWKVACTWQRRQELGNSGAGSQASRSFNSAANRLRLRSNWSSHPRLLLLTTRCPVSGS